MQIQLDQLRAAAFRAEGAGAKERADKAAKDIRQALSALTREGQASVTEGALGLTVDLDAKFLFGPAKRRCSRPRRTSSRRSHACCFTPIFRWSSRATPTIVR
jgi:hypothetical protein